MGLIWYMLSWTVLHICCSLPINTHWIFMSGLCYRDLEKIGKKTQVAIEKGCEEGEISGQINGTSS